MVLQLVGDVSKLHKDPIQQWIRKGVTFKFTGDNVDKKKRVRDMRSAHQGEMLHMYSVLVAWSRVPPMNFSQTGQVADIMSLSWRYFLPNRDDVREVKKNLVVIVS